MVGLLTSLDLPEAAAVAAERLRKFEETGERTYKKFIYVQDGDSIEYDDDYGDSFDPETSEDKREKIKLHPLLNDICAGAKCKPERARLRVGQTELHKSTLSALSENATEPPISFIHVAVSYRSFSSGRSVGPVAHESTTPLTVQQIVTAVIESADDFNRCKKDDRFSFPSKPGVGYWRIDADVNGWVQLDYYGAKPTYDW